MVINDQDIIDITGVKKFVISFCIQCLIIECVKYCKTILAASPDIGQLVVTLLHGMDRIKSTSVVC